MDDIKTRRLKAIQKFIHSCWKDSDKEDLLMEILEDHLDADQLHQLILDQDMDALIFD